MEQKGRWVITQVRNKMGSYVDARKVRVPRDMVLKMRRQPMAGAIGRIQWGPEDEVLRAGEGVKSGQQVLDGGPELGGSVTESSSSISPRGDEKMVDIDWVSLF